MKLPIDDLLPDVRAGLRGTTSLVIEAPPGAGKTTRVPPALLDESWLDGRRIIMLEPRRLATRAAAAWMAATLGESVGDTVGYRMRLDTRCGPRTRLDVVTEGVLTRMLQQDPSLDGVGALIFDEFHERSLHADTGLALALQARSILRPDLRIVIMSATLDGESVAELLGGAPILRSHGRTHPVETIHVPHDRTDRLEDLVERTIRAAIAAHDGDLLVFLPGAAEIRRTAGRIEDLADAAVDVLPLFGNLSSPDQERAIRPSLPDRRKVVLATAIAETSLTIEGVRVVIDAGLMRVPRFSARTGMTRLDTVRVTRDAADQRRGRAGRTAPGVCYRLWSAGEDAGLVPRRTPEILDADLAPLALELAAWGVSDAAALRWLDPPPPAALAQARETLVELGAIDRNGRPTDHGRRLAEWPAHPRVAHMIVMAGDAGAAALGCDLAALIDDRDILRSREGLPDPDIRLRLDVLRRAMADGIRAAPHSVGAAHVDRQALARARTTALDWRRRLRVPSAGDALVESASPGIVLAFAYPDRIGQRRTGRRGRFLLRSGTGATLPDPHPLAGEDLIVAASIGGRGREAVVFLAAPVDQTDIEHHFADQIETSVDVEWIPESRAVRATRRTRLGAIVLAEANERHPPMDRVVQTLISGIRTDGLDTLPWNDDARALRDRLQFLHSLDGTWPDVSDAVLLDSLESWLTPWLASRNRTDLQDLDVSELLMSLVDVRLRGRVDELAPDRLEVPSGSRIRIDYSDPAAPALPVRLQEMFGLEDTPRIGGDTVPLTLRLLSPAMRPVQVTRDLASFWRHGYFEVRKDLRGRYPKHFWPDDPVHARATRRTRPRGS